MAARRPSKLGLHNQDPPPRHALVTEVRGGVTYYIGANGSCFRMLRTLSKCLAGHMLLAECVRREVRPDGSIAFAPTGEHRALKRLSKYHLEHGISLDGRRISEDPVLEIGAMHYLSKRPPHGNVMFMHAVYEDASFLFLELECLGGGDLFEAVQGSPGGKFPEARARRVLRQVLQGLCFMHGHGIIHRDLSLENVMLASRDPGAEVKIIDMGLCVDRWRFAPGLIPPQGCVGKASYMAPETYLDSEFDESVDLWCVAVMLFMMLFGVPPYRKPHAGLCALFREIEAGRLLDLVAKWGMGGSVSPDAQDLLRRMLSVSRADRPTLPEVLAHPWMAPEMADLGGAARAAEQASLVLDVGARVNRMLHEQRQQAAAAASGAAAAAPVAGGKSTGEWSAHGAGAGAAAAAAPGAAAASQHAAAAGPTAPAGGGQSSSSSWSSSSRAAFAGRPP